MTVNQQPPKRASTAAELADLRQEILSLACDVRVQIALLAAQGMLPAQERDAVPRPAHEPPEGYPPTPRQIREARRHGLHAVKEASR
jgi:hypothetical protein